MTFEEAIELLQQPNHRSQMKIWTGTIKIKRTFAHDEKAASLRREKLTVADIKLDRGIH